MSQLNKYYTNKIVFCDDPVHKITCVPILPSEGVSLVWQTHLTWLKQMDGHYQRVGTNRMHDWTLVKNDTKAHRDLDRDATNNLS